ncbi:GNAT family N-acetyltransferase [Kitasatospora sp. NBC_01266]|uniref:GNAT family N-acetyltransferase n=1 Tax=Kitasatospora sp. NBC_01266 TaxID=2903572 RepID=UPI002E321C26|nr:GNAT family N-acetyltransferase [Kitasatospora sp. NBC_01266]
MVITGGAPQVGDEGLLVCPELADAELNALFDASWPAHRPISFAPMFARSLLWIAARRGSRLAGFVNVVGDGGAHAFILDTTVHPDERRQGLGVRLVRAAAEGARARGAQWLHVDYEPHLESFYGRCGFRPTAAGLLRL